MAGSVLSVSCPVLFCGSGTAYLVYLDGLVIAAGEVYIIPFVTVYGVGVGILAHPVAFVAAQGQPVHQAFLPVHILDGDVGAVLLMGVRAIVCAVLEDGLDLAGDLDRKSVV